MACAQCHTHKYDPITQSDYYRLMATMNNAEEPPLYDLGTESVRLKNLEIDQQIAQLKAQLPDQFPGPARPRTAGFADHKGRPALFRL